ncbi:uncharacterized protein [Rutidosis leptorrhynchoides]|uniref:uncharacterized protein n=1 Tax=Rutidosis leptorrhynchoides TaxID=125765 RepID=UPI003A999923
MANKDKSGSNVVEAPLTPGRPVFSFSVGSRKNVPSKWDNAQKWLISSPDSPAANHGIVKSPDFVSKYPAGNNNNGFVGKPPPPPPAAAQQQKHVDTKTEVCVFQVPSSVMPMCMEHEDHHNVVSPSEESSDSDVLLKDKYTNGNEANYSRFRCVMPIKEGFLFTSMKDASTEVVHEIKQADTMGTNMTPRRNSAASRSPTPFKTVSPPRHNTPCMSGPLSSMNVSSSFDIAELQECHLAKLQLETPFDSVTCNWSSREEEEADVSKSLRHFEMNNECVKHIPDPTKPCDWEEEEEEKIKSHLKYQREEAKIQAWVDLQNAKAEAQSRKLEVKIQKMRSKFEEKMMKRMMIVHRKADELRTEAKYEHDMQFRKASTRSTKTNNLHQSMHISDPISPCGCFPCSTSQS